MCHMVRLRPSLVSKGCRVSKKVECGWSTSRGRCGSRANCVKLLTLFLSRASPCTLRLCTDSVGVPGQLCLHCMHVRLSASL